MNDGREARAPLDVEISVDATGVEIDLSGDAELAANGEAMKPSIHHEAVLEELLGQAGHEIDIEAVIALSLAGVERPLKLDVADAELAVLTPEGFLLDAAIRKLVDPSSMSAFDEAEQTDAVPVVQDSTENAPQPQVEGAGVDDRPEPETQEHVEETAIGEFEPACETPVEPPSVEPPSVDPAFVEPAFVEPPPEPASDPRYVEPAFIEPAAPLLTDITQDIGIPEATKPEFRAPNLTVEDVMSTGGVEPGALDLDPVDDLQLYSNDGVLQLDESEELDETSEEVPSAKGKSEGIDYGYEVISNEEIEMESYIDVDDAPAIRPSYESYPPEEGLMPVPQAEESFPTTEHEDETFETEEHPTEKNSVDEVIAVMDDIDHDQSLQREDEPDDADWEVTEVQEDRRQEEAESNAEKKKGFFRKLFGGQ